MTIRVNNVELGGGGGGGGGEVTGAAVLAALVEAPFTLTTWTPTESGGAEVVVDADEGTAVATILDGVDPTTAFSVRPWSAGDSFDVRCRVKITGSTSANLITYFAVTFGAAWLHYRLRGDGNLRAMRTVGGSSILAELSGQPRDGTLHLRIERRGSRLTMSHATSASDTTFPAESGWTTDYDDVVAALATRAPDGLRVQAGTEGATLPAAAEITWSDCTLRSGRV